MITASDLIQITGISVGAVFALLTLLVGFFVWVVNRQDKTNDRRHSETKESVDNLRQDTKDEFAKVRAEMKDDFAKVRAETKDEFAEVRTEMKDEFTKIRAEMAQMFQRYNEENERRHQEVMKAIGLLYQHTHGEDGRIIIPIDGANIVVPPAAPSPAAD